MCAPTQEDAALEAAHVREAGLQHEEALDLLGRLRVPGPGPLLRRVGPHHDPLQESQAALKHHLRPRLGQPRQRVPQQRLAR